MSSPPPAFVLGSALLEGSYAFALFAHHGERRRADTDIEHPVAVAELLHREGFSEQVVAAALLHDVIEDTTTEVAEIRRRFGPEVGDLVTEMTEDQSIRSYRERKREHRQRVASDRSAAAIYAADKLATTRVLAAHGEAPAAQRLEHFRATLVSLANAYPTLPFLAELRGELDRLPQV